MLKVHLHSCFLYWFFIEIISSVTCNVLICAINFSKSSSSLFFNATIIINWRTRLLCFVGHTTMHCMPVQATLAAALVANKLSGVLQNQWSSFSATDIHCQWWWWRPSSRSLTTLPSTAFLLFFGSRQFGFTFCGRHVVLSPSFLSSLRAGVAITI